MVVSRTPVVPYTGSRFLRLWSSAVLWVNEHM